MSGDVGRGRPVASARTRTDDVGTDPHANVGAYVVDALEPPERAEFRAHLESCDNCRREVTEFRETTAELALLVATRPPAELRAATLAGLRGVRPLPPEQRGAVVRHVPPPPSEELAPLDEHPSVMPWSLELGARPQESPKANPDGRLRQVNRLLLGLVAALTVIALALGGWLVATTAQRSGEVAAAQAEAERQTALLSAPDAKLLPTTLNGARVSFVVSQQQNQALFTGDAVPAPAPGTVYQLWAVEGETPISMGVVPVGGVVRVWLAGSVAGADELALTSEPGPGGSPKPTSDPLTRVDL